MKTVLGGGPVITNYQCDQCNLHLTGHDNPICISTGYGHHVLDTWPERPEYHFCGDLCVIAFFQAMVEKHGAYKAQTHNYTMTTPMTGGTTTTIIVDKAMG